MYKEVFSARLKHTRTIKGYTQEVMANHLGVSRSTYTLWETGRREPDLETLGKISELLETNLNWLMGTEDYKKS